MTTKCVTRFSSPLFATLLLCGLALAGARAQGQVRGLPPLFSDPFESGDACSWSLVVTADLCDGVDADCDGMTDEDAPPARVLWVDPPLAYAAIDAPVTVYVEGLSGAGIAEVRVAPAGSGQPGQTLAFSFDPATPHRVGATVPAGLSTGDYDVRVEDVAGCVADPTAGLTVVDTLGLTLTGIDPPFGWNGRATPVAIDGAGFSELPALYFVPSSAPPGTVATPLAGVTFVGATALTAVVPPGLSGGSYDVVAINPDGQVGVAPDVFEVTTAAPPHIDAVLPGSVPNSGMQSLVLRGSGFDTTAVELQCDGGLDVAGTVGTVTASSVDVTVATDTIPALTACVVRATNADGSFADFSALGVTGVTGNIAATVSEPVLSTARRAPAAVTARATPSQSFLYAIGGDSGTASGALSSVEVAPLDRFGRPGSWRTLGQALPEARTLAGAVAVGRHVFLVGGNGGSGPVSSVRRAEVLDPEDAPAITDLVLEPAVSGLGAGVWYYRVAAVMDSADLDNPDGETLGSVAEAVRIPSGLSSPVAVTVRWDPVVGAAQYRLYRSPAAGDGAAAVELLATVAAPGIEHTDSGLPTTPSELPRRLGDLGTWKAMSALGGVREGLGVAWAVDPADPSITYLYAVGGRNGDGTALGSYEVLGLDSATGHPVLPAPGTWTPQAGMLGGGGRWQLAVYRVDAVATTRLTTPADVWLYAGPGLDSDGMEAKVVDAALVGTDGELGTWTSVPAPAAGFAGYGMFAGANQLFVFGGQGAAPSSSALAAEICGVGHLCSGGAPDPPDLDNWNNAGFSLQVPRHLPGHAVGSARVFLVGGVTTGPAATDTVESALW